MRRALNRALCALPHNVLATVRKAVRPIPMPVNLSARQIESALPRVSPGLTSYVWLQHELPLRDVSHDTEFQKRFGGFYRVRRDSNWRAFYFKNLEDAKRRPITFKEALQSLHKATGRVEASFASKLVATVDPCQPVIDSVVLHNLRLKLPPRDAPDPAVRLDAIVNLHARLTDLYTEFLASDSGRDLVAQFRHTYPDAGVSEIKMLDLVLWQSR